MIDVSQIKPGDRVRLQHEDGTTSPMVKVEESNNPKQVGYVVFAGGLTHISASSWSIIEHEPKSILPTKNYALVGHPTEQGFLAYLLVDGEWWAGGCGSCQSDPAEVEDAMRNFGFEVLFEGVGE